MITGEIKNKVDKVWNTFWNNGFSSPISILEQMTYLFFMKLLDDKQQKEESNANLFGVKLTNPTFKEGNWHNPDSDKDVPYNELRWHVFKDMDPEKMLRRVRNDAFVFLCHMGDKSSAYSRSMQNTVFLINDARMLSAIVDGIDDLDMNDTDTMGDVYEYMLGKMAASGTNGQFRTPRHIIRMMVDMMQPTLDDTICDPAMGSAGFIMESAGYVKEHQKEQLLNNKFFDHYKNTMFHGADSDGTMMRIGCMNMMLHDVNNPQMFHRSSLSDDNTDTNKYSLILANPPFAGSLDTNNVAASLRSIVNTPKTELLFLALFMRMLKTGGRCASIVPDTVLTGDNNAYTTIRKELVDGHCLRAVISMPSGVFQPYSGVSTAIIVFTKTGTGGTDKVWFYDMQHDGFSLTTQRLPQPEQNDIPDLIARFHNQSKETERDRKAQSFFVSADEIRQNNYNLSYKKYHEVEHETVEYEATADIMHRMEERGEELRTMFNDFKNLMEE